MTDRISHYMISANMSEVQTYQRNHGLASFCRQEQDW